LASKQGRFNKKIAGDRNLKKKEDIILSYFFFRVKP
jgi:cytochrome c oxidase assembly protein Cox11